MLLHVMWGGRGNPCPPSKIDERKLIMGYLVAGIILLFLIIWVIIIQRRLAGLDEKISSCLNRIGIQISSQLDVLCALITLLKEYAADDAQKMCDMIKSSGNNISADSAPSDVSVQIKFISEMINRFSVFVQQFPTLIDDEDYTKCIRAMEGYDKMLVTSRLICNDSVARYNREIISFPSSLIARIFGYRQKDYIEKIEIHLEVLP